MWKEWFICAVVHIYPAITQSSEVWKRSTADLIPCERGWFYFRDSCYKLGGKKESGRLNQEWAKSKCISEGGNLATIQSKELQEFLVTFLLLDASTNAWIGLHDRDSESKYGWEDGSVDNYTNWGPGEPSGPHREEEDCVEMVFDYHRGGGITGQWNDLRCSDLRAYICESKISQKSSPDPRFCSDMPSGWKYQNSCYNVVNEKKSWKDAEQYCQDTFNGHLLTIPDFTIDIYLQHILSNFDREVWIGIKIQEQSLQQWTSGWYVGYNEWDKDQREDFIHGTCSLRSKEKLWRKTPCSNKYSFICETSSVGPPVLKQPVKGARCPDLPDDWLDLGGEFCYFFHFQSNLNGYQANFECTRRGGFLASIHSKEETILLHQFIKYTQNRLHIGLTRLKANENVFVWTDGSQVDYENWDNNEPDRENELCVAVRVQTMKWFDDDCQDIDKGYICSVRKVLPTGTEISAKSNWPTSPNVTDISGKSCLSGVSTDILIAVSICLVVILIGGVSIEILIAVSVCNAVVVILIFIVICCFRRGREQRKKMTSGIQLQSAIPSSPGSKHRSPDVIIKGDGGYYENMD